ncbi:hypothetical protein EYF80_053499 [Liparis tanakae]|uniref:Uncharacterized protein n=1 Tax=Liparis tanakae TaxID=230148 RepID=A0A4Z2F6D6_9TELE|nr:hypothetical protein EYF80_053499 [Liparis tanakae]
MKESARLMDWEEMAILKPRPSAGMMADVEQVEVLCAFGGEARSDAQRGHVAQGPEVKGDARVLAEGVAPGQNPAGHGTQEEPARCEFCGTRAQARHADATPSTTLVTLTEAWLVLWKAQVNVTEAFLVMLCEYDCFALLPSHDSTTVVLFLFTSCRGRRHGKTDFSRPESEAGTLPPETRSEGGGQGRSGGAGIQECGFSTPKKMKFGLESLQNSVTHLKPGTCRLRIR